MKKVFLFDLDSTLLQMDQDKFLEGYFKLVAAKAAKLKYDPKTFMDNFQKGAYLMVKNNGSITNEEAFWNVMASSYNDIDILKNIFEAFYQNEFKELKKIVTVTDIPNKIIKTLKEKGYQIILATNPLFPKICTYERIDWAGLDPLDFLDITTYETSTYSKPNRKYYEEVLNRNNINPADCIMVGNDLDDDFSDLPDGIDKILITDHLINANNRKIDMKAFKLCEFLEYIKNNY